ncbi:hypothetical protein BC629DRAFT_591195 [Irpex lacteus]|nr:hypothetical protein BC629DRAFT_591195 [Irpex lacteus]
MNTLFFKVFYLFAFIALLAPSNTSAARRDDAGHLGRVYGQFGGVAKRLTNAQRLSRGLPPNKPVVKRNGAIRARASATFSASDSASVAPSSLIPLPPTSSVVSSSTPSSSVASSSLPPSSPISSIIVPPPSSSAPTSAAPVSSSSSSAAATPVCTPNVGAAQASRKLAIDLGNSGSLSGYYVSGNPGNGGIVTVTQSASAAQNVMFTPCADSSVTFSLLRVAASTFPYLGAARAGSPADLGGSSIAYITYVSRTYSPAVSQLNSWTVSSSTESSIWLYDLNTGKITAQWVNSDGAITHVQTILTGQNQLALVEDFSAYHAIDPQSQLAVLRLY